MDKNEITQLVSQLENAKDLLIKSQTMDNRKNVGIALKKVKESIDVLLDEWEDL